MKRVKLFSLLPCNLFILIVLVMAFTCWGQSMDNKNESLHQSETIDQVPQEKWAELSQKNIFFGHQSVGNNIMDGVATVIKKNPQIKLNIVEINSGQSSQPPFFAHNGNIGKNHDPESKIASFVSYVHKGIYNADIDIAFLKFCFVDFNAKTDIKKLFVAYKNKMAELKKEHPGLTIVHFTVPLLRKKEHNFKTWIKGLFKEDDGFFADSHNVMRNKYNTLITEEYRGQEPLFDIAKYESTYPDGSRETFTYDGNNYFSLVPDYTDDGGHLNKTGRKYIAEKLLIYLANLH